MSSVSRARAHVRGHPRASPRRTHASTARAVHRARRHYFPSTASTAPRPPRAFARVHHRPIARGRSPREVIHPRARASNHPSPSSSPARDDDERDATRRANTRAHTPSPLHLSRASHRIERDAPTTPRARVMRCDARPADGSPLARGADEWPRRGDRGGGTHDESRSVTIARARGEGFDRSIERSVASIDRQGTTKTDHCHIHTDRRPLCPDDGPLSHT